MRALVLIALLALTACREDAAPPLAPVGAARIDTLRADCERSGGALLPTGKGNLACLRQTGDNGKTCTRQTDCEGMCLARSGTCAPVKPLFGCHDILTADGVRQTLCLD